MRQAFVCFFIIFNPVLTLAEFEIATPLNPSLAPSFEGTTPAESHLKHHELNGLAHAKMNEKEGAGHLVTTSAASRPQIKVSSSEHLISDADKIVRDPKDILDSSFEERAEESEEGDSSEHKCQENTEEQALVFEQNLIRVVGVQQKRIFIKTWYWKHLNDGSSPTQGTRHPEIPPTSVDYHEHGFNHFCNCVWNYYDFYERRVGIDLATGELTPLDEWRLVTKDFVEKTQIFPERVKEHISLKVIQDADQDEWSSLPTFEADTELACERQEKTCTRGPVTLTIQGQTIARPCIQYQYTYACKMDQSGSCLTLRGSSACHQIRSRCTREVGGACLQFEQTFRCQNLKLKPHRIHTRGPIPCLDGSCVKSASWEVNQDLPEVISKLSVFSEMRKDMEAHTGQVFSGNNLKCNRECVGFKDCCKRFAGWGVDTGLSSCNEEERLLSDLRNKKRCVFVGSFCAERLLGACIRKKFSFCCFASPLARIIHEQGRAQLGIDWGSAEHPNCRALSVEELTRIQFDRLNLSEITADLVGKIKAPDIGRITERFAEDWRERLPTSKVTGRTGPDLPSTMHETLKARQESIHANPGKYSLNQDGRKEGSDAQLVF